MPLSPGQAPRVVLWRILGNDLMPRHAPGQTLRNLEFILEHETDFPGCEKRFLLNRIIDGESVEKVCTLLQQGGMGYEVIPFARDVYLAQSAVEDQVRYLTNVNAARNHCIRRGLSMAPITLPLDGNCFFNRAGWEGFFEVAERHPEAAAFIVAMWRLRNNQHALQGRRRPRLRETIRRRLWVLPVAVPVEPQVGFSRTSDVLFDEQFVYSKCDKAELLWRLGISGPWDSWDDNLRKWTRGRNGVSKYFGDRRVLLDAGFVCRLASGNRFADTNFSHRGDVRKEGLANLRRQADHMCGREHSP